MQNYSPTYGIYLSCIHVNTQIYMCMYVYIYLYIGQKIHPMRFVPNSCLQDPHHLSIPAFGALLNLRKAACDYLYNKRIRDAAAVAGDVAPRHRSAREEDIYVAGRVVQMRCPEVTLGEESTEARTMNSLWSVRDPMLWVELTAENLECISLFLRKGLAEDEVLRRRKSLRGDREDSVLPIPGKSSPKRRRRAQRRKRARGDDEAEAGALAAEAANAEAAIAEPPAAPADEESDASDVLQDILDS